ncbi:MAG TPA: DUF1501 domain-containing protein [Casimicrobiaceae bacterium]|nr:DUF1501 domain-containing protein [Casimicrobiaceae bacterium]
MSTNRRQFLARTTALTGAAMAGTFGRLGIQSAHAQAVTDYKALVCLFQFGGADSNNMLPPDTDYAQYALVRTPASQVALTQAEILKVTAARQGGKSYGFHPNLALLKDLYDQKKLAVVANAGTLLAPITLADYKAGKNRPPNLFSHSDQQMLWQGLLPGDIVRSGWGGRLADKLVVKNAGQKIPTMVSVSGTQIFNSGHDTVPFVIPGSGGVLLSGQGADAVSTARYNALKTLLGTGGGHQLFDGAAAILNESLDAAEAANPYLTPALPQIITDAFTINGTLLNTGLANQLKQVARLIEGRAALGVKRQFFMVNIGGWDTHSNILTNQNNLFNQMGPAMRAFYNYTVAAGIANDVTQFTMSDFNRTFIGNQSLGTDHAYGGNYLVVGGAVKGGDIYGTYPTLVLKGPDDTGSNGAWLPTTSVDQIGNTLATWFGMSSADIDYAFPNLANWSAGTKNIGFL